MERLTAASLIFMSALIVVSGLGRAGAQDVPILAGVAAPNTPGEIYWQRYRDDIRALSDGRLDATLMIRGEAGPEEQQYTAVRRNRIQIAGISTGTLSLAVPELAVLRAPFLFESMAEVSAVLDDHLRPVVSEKLAEHNLVLLTWMMDGWQDLYSIDPIRVPADVRSRKLRVSIDSASQLFLRAIGADVIQISLTDVIPGLQTGLIEGGEQSTQIFALAGIAGTAPYLTLTHHAYSTAVVVANKRWWDGLSDADRAVYGPAAPDANWYRGLVEDMNAAYIARAADVGLTVITPTEDERAAWRGAGLAVHDEVVSATEGDAQAFYEAVLAAKAAVAAK
jgi:TRAP-type C4-dicarboxylate transport system substrate-binding protein